MNPPGGKVAVLRKGDEVLIGHVELAATFRERSVGLLGRGELPSGQALWLCPCSSIHTFGMHFAIDLIYLARDLCVVRIVRDVHPNRVSFGGWAARSVIELQAGWFPDGGVAVGDMVALEGVG